jgi:apolipoprotein N-acyltransferase
MKTLVSKLAHFPQAFLTYPVLGQLAISLLVGILMGCTVAPMNAWFFAWVAIVPLWWFTYLPVQQTQTAFPALRSLGCGIVWGIGYHGVALSWMTGLHPLTWLGMPWIVSVAVTLFAWSFGTAWGAALAGVWAWLLAVAAGRHWGFNRGTLRGLRGDDSPGETLKAALPAWLRILIGVALWSGLEAVWSHGPLYWSSISYTQSPHNPWILHLGQLSGPTFVTGAIVAVNGLFAEAWMRWSQQESFRAKKLIVWNLGLLLTLHLVGFGLYHRPLQDAPATALTVGIIQGNVPTRIKHFEEGVQLSFDRYTRGYVALAEQGVDAVLTPEGAFPWLWLGTLLEARHPFFQAILEQGVPAWVGTVGVQQQRITQSLFTIDGSGEIFSRYDKIKPVPLGEYIPFEAFLGNFIDRLSPVSATMIPGSPNQQIATPFGQAIVGICFDSAFPWLFRNQAATGGQFILTASNNDPYNAAMMAQHHAQDVMRAIETDRWALRATNTGFSGVIDPHGRPEWMSGFRTYGTHAHTVFRRSTRTLYVRWGDWGLLVLIGLAIGGRVWAWIRHNQGI